MQCVIQTQRILSRKKTKKNGKNNSNKAKEMYYCLLEDMRYTDS